MKNKIALLTFLTALVLGAVVFHGCKKDDEPADLKLSALTAGTIDLNGATSPTDVPVDVAFTATFTANIDPASATAANITLTQDYDNANIPVQIAVASNVITITPQSALGNGTLYKLEFKGGLLSTDAKPLTDLTRTFTTFGTFSPAGMIAHWTFEDNANDVVGNFNPSANGVVAITYTASRNAAAGKAATFNGTTSIIEIPNGDQLINTHDFSLSFWVKTNSTGIDHGHFVMGLGAFYGLQFEIFGAYDGAKFAIQYEFADGTTGAEDMWFPSDATDNTNGGWQGWDFAKSIPAADMMALLKDNWLHVTYVYDATAKKGTLYYNGEKMKSFDFNLWPEGDAKTTTVGLKYAGQEPDVVNELAFGFIHSRAGTMWDSEPWGGYDFPGANHFKGQLDDVKIFHKAITPTEVQLMYNSEKP